MKLSEPENVGERSDEGLRREREGVRTLLWSVNNLKKFWMSVALEMAESQFELSFNFTTFYNDIFQKLVCFSNVWKKSYILQNALAF